jgi:DNA-binding LacI/PurR family transcriptional regulator
MAQDPQKRLQMADIARLAGVSVSTVSRALSGSGLVNEETRQRVAELARSMNYTVNLGAQALRLRKNQTIAVVVPFDASTRQHISDPFFLAIVGALADALTERGYDMLLSRVDLEQLDTAARLVDGGKAIGLIVIGQWRQHEHLNALADRGVPLVVWGAHMPHQRYCSVGGDNLAGGLMATRHLLAGGRRHIAFLGDASLPEVMLRHEGHLQALAEAGIARDALLDLPVPFEVGAARTTLDALFASGRPVDGVLACSDLLALQALQAAQAAGREVPRDVAVVGYDDMPLAACSSPALTSVHQPLDQAGTNIVDALLGLLAGETVAPRTLPVHLVVRDSAP